MCWTASAGWRGVNQSGCACSHALQGHRIRRQPAGPRSVPRLSHVVGEVDAREFRAGKADAGSGYDVHDIDREGDRLGANRRDIFDGQAICRGSGPSALFLKWRSEVDPSASNPCHAP